LWNPLHVERGWAAHEDVVTVQSNTDYLTFSSDLEDPERLLDALASLARARPIHVDEFVGQLRSVVILIGPRHRSILEMSGWTKAGIRNYLHPLLIAPQTFGPTDRVGWGTHPTGNVGEYALYLPREENIHLVAAGGPNSPTLVLYPHQSCSVSAAVTTNGMAGRTVPAAGVVNGRNEGEAQISAGGAAPFL
jgi:hypothetical protein